MTATNASQPEQARLFTLILLTALSTATLNLFVPSLVNIAEDLQADYNVVSLSIGVYLAAMTVVQLVVGPLSDKIGRRPVLLGSLVLFTLASAGCAFATDVRVFLAFRMLQSAMVAGYVLSMAMVRDTTNAQDAASRLGYVSMAMAVAPMMGPVLGGFLDSLYGWRSNFYFLILCGVALFIWCWIDLKETHLIDKKPTQEPSESTWQLMREPGFWAYSLCTTFSTASLYIFLTGAPLVAQSEFGLSTAELGIYFATGTAGFMLGSYLSGRYASGIPATTMMLAGRLTTCLGIAVGFSAALAGVLTWWLFFGSIVFVGLGNGLTIPSSNAQTLSIRPQLAGAAAGISGAAIVALGAPLSMLTGKILPEEGASTVVLFLMLCTSLISLATVFWAKQLENGTSSTS